jgi:hypothetical protein
MARPCQRVRLENGLKLNLNVLAQQRIIQPGACSGPVGIRWMNFDTDEEIATGIIAADMSGIYEGWLRIRIGQLDQRITLIARPRHFGGRQWYFVCPFVKRRASVLWKPLGAKEFSCRQRWGRQVAYVSQFLDQTNRAHRGKAKINNKLCAIGGFNPDEWELPPKPKWMRWRTYNRAEEKFDQYEAILNEGLLMAAIRLGFRF